MSCSLRDCVNCGKTLSASIMVMHESFCKRNMTKCPQCQEVIYKNEVEEHMEEEHSTGHCTFCNLEIRNEKLMEHVVICGSRTTECALCMTNVVIMDFKSHVEMCEKLFGAPNARGDEKENGVPENAKVEQGGQIRQDKVLIYIYILDWRLAMAWI